MSWNQPEGWAQEGVRGQPLLFSDFFSEVRTPSYRAQSGHDDCTNHKHLAPAQSGPSPIFLNVRTCTFEVKLCWTQRQRVFGKGQTFQKLSGTQGPPPQFRVGSTSKARQPHEDCSDTLGKLSR